MKIGDLVNWLDSLDPEAGIGIIVDISYREKSDRYAGERVFYVYTERHKIETFSSYELTSLDGNENERFYC